MAGILYKENICNKHNIYCECCEKNIPVGEKYFIYTRNKPVKTKQMKNAYRVIRYSICKDCK